MIVCVAVGRVVDVKIVVVMVVVAGLHEAQGLNSQDPHMGHDSKRGMTVRTKY
jgi:hypothetical protein